MSTFLFLTHFPSRLAVPDDVAMQATRSSFLANFVQGNVYKNKRVLIDAIHKKKAEKIKATLLQEQQDARKARAKAQRERAAAKKAAQ